MAAETRVRPSSSRSQAAGVRGELGADDEQLALEAQDDLGQARRAPAFRTP